MSIKRKAILIPAILLISFLALLLLYRWQPWQTKRMVLSAQIPGTRDSAELWEKPSFDFLSLSTEYETWLRITLPDGQSEWHLIDKQYITFRRTAIFLSADEVLLRVETSKGSSATHMIVEYDLKKREFRSHSAETVRNKPGWRLLIERKIH